MPCIKKKKKHCIKPIYSSKIRLFKRKKSLIVVFCVFGRIKIAFFTTFSLLFFDYASKLIKVPYMLMFYRLIIIL